MDEGGLGAVLKFKKQKKLKKKKKRKLSASIPCRVSACV